MGALGAFLAPDASEGGGVGEEAGRRDGLIADLADASDAPGLAFLGSQAGLQGSGDPMDPFGGVPGVLSPRLAIFRRKGLVQAEPFPQTGKFFLQISLPRPQLLGKVLIKSRTVICSHTLPLHCTR